MDEMDYLGANCFQRGVGLLLREIPPFTCYHDLMNVIITTTCYLYIESHADHVYACIACILIACIRLCYELPHAAYNVKDQFAHSAAQRRLPRVPLALYTCPL